jgi:pyrimidine-nucleoside phosphorylase
VRAVDIIVKKRDHGELTKEEIEFFISGYTRGEIPDYQASAWAMAVLLNGMTPQETTDLTLAMAYSGDTIDLSDYVEIAVDKHSTGGVGDKTSLVVGPVVAACGLPVGKMSGRSLGFSGGTLDKLESIPGFRTNLTTSEFIHQLVDVGLVICGQTADLAPADGKLYALRDVTGTVQSIPLIASSVMSKKIASGAQSIVLDIKVGTGAFMKTLEDAQQLAKLMVSIAYLAKRRSIALLSNMNQPLGNSVGNALELIEAINTLHGQGPQDFWQHCQEVAAQMLILGDKAKHDNEAKKLIYAALENGKAWSSFLGMVEAQGGDISVLENTSKLPRAAIEETLLSPKEGYIKQVNAQIIGEIVVGLGGGRSKKGEAIDHSVGVITHIKVGDKVAKNQPMISIYANSKLTLKYASEKLLKAISWSDDPVPPLTLFYGKISYGVTGTTGISQ